MSTKSEVSPATRRKNAVESITWINNDLWESGGPYSQHLTIVDDMSSRGLLRRLLFPSAPKNEQDRGYKIFGASIEKYGDLETFRSLVITADNMFALSAIGKSMSVSTQQQLDRRQRVINLSAIPNGEDNENSIFIAKSELEPLSELPDPERTLQVFAEDINDRLSRTLDWHIEIPEDQQATRQPGGLVYM